ncbi:sporulation protein [Paenibacillus sp. y28]|uniref:sporulation protein n=1 Tax=Paenibacillus sp. y28 TaxID=3129110 RepID=UPI00301B482F
MSIFNRMMASIGIGSAKVDLRLDTHEAAAGERLGGVVAIRGGKISQRIDNIYVHLYTEYHKEETVKTTDGKEETRKLHVTHRLAEYRLGENLSIDPGETRELPFVIELPALTPMTTNRDKVWLRTGLDINNAIDPGDKDVLHVLPHAYTQIVLDAVYQLGFAIKEITNEHDPRSRNGVPFIQNIEFAPKGPYRALLDELEIAMFPREDGIELLIEIDRRARGLTGFFAEMLDMDESLHLLWLSAEEVEQGPGAVAVILAELINRHAL